MKMRADWVTDVCHQRLAGPEDELRNCRYIVSSRHRQMTEEIKLINKNGMIMNGVKPGVSIDLKIVRLKDSILTKITYAMTYQKL